jgi:hypothetical protein
MIEIGYITANMEEVVVSEVVGAQDAQAEVDRLKADMAGQDIYTFFMQIRMGDEVKKYAFIDPA